ncbi:MAG: GNAT family N-acetyltransferase [Acidimicrobiia bacterium]
MKSVSDLEAALYDTWTPDESATIAGWTVHANGGFTRRVNCATGVGAPDTDPGAREEITAWLTARGGQPIVRVTPLLAASAVAAIHIEWGYAAFDETVVLAAPVQAAARDPAVEIVGVDDEAFFDNINALNNRHESSKQAWRRLLGRIKDRAAGLLVHDVGVALVASSGPIAEVYTVAVAPAHRRQGIARSLMATAHAWARTRACEIVSLQVGGTNAPALALYDELGYSEAYRYHYLQPLGHSSDGRIDGC